MMDQAMYSGGLINQSTRDNGVRIAPFGPQLHSVQSRLKPSESNKVYDHLDRFEGLSASEKDQVTPDVRKQRTPLFSRIIFKIMDWMETSRQRRQLGSLSDDLLKDIGLCRADADNERVRVFWDVRERKDDNTK